jgi:gluconokinase
MSAWIVMGVAGCGKSTIAEALAEKAGGDYLDADAFHPPENIAKMAAAIPLTDEDRWPWLDRLNRELRERSAAGRSTFLACSALRQVYRDRLAEGVPGFHVVYLQGSKELILQRMQARQGHFMRPELLDSQFATLEEPVDAITMSVAKPVSEIVDDVLRHAPASR